MGVTPEEQWAEDVAYFNRGRAENPRFWERLGGMPDLRDTVVLDMGCGHGSFCISLAEAGAREVIGADVDARRIEFAQQYLEREFAPLVDTVSFRAEDIREARERYPDNTFDYVVTKDTLEHVLDLDTMCAEVKRVLKPGGRFCSGIGPIYNSPLGDHRRLEAGFPWGHLILNEARLIDRLNARHGSSVETVYDLGLNKMSLADYRRCFRESGMEVVEFRVNESKRPMSRVFSVMRKVPFLEEYFSHNIWCILEKHS